MTQAQKDWVEICGAFAREFGYKLLFVNENSCGVELKNGQFKHIYADEMFEFLKQNFEKPSKLDDDTWKDDMERDAQQYEADSGE